MKWSIQNLKENRIFFSILVLAIFLRFFKLELRPPHFDEGVNGNLVDTLMPALGFYKYRPEMFHGPLHFYMLALSKFIFGRSLWSLRFPPVMFGIATVWLAYGFRKFIGQRAALLFALLLGVSPGLVYYSRDGIQESEFLFFSVLFFYGGIGSLARPARLDLWFFLIGATGMILTKELWIFNVFFFLIAAMLNRSGLRQLRSTLGVKFLKKPITVKDIFLSTSVSLAILAIFYSGFFQYPQGAFDLFSSFKPWFTRGEGERAAFKPFYFWLELMVFNEPGSFTGLLIGLYAILRRKRFAFASFTAIYGCGLIFVYSTISYKTPWCALQLVWPFYLILACTLTLTDGFRLANQHYLSKRDTSKLVAFSLHAFSVIILVVSLAKAVQLSFINYDLKSERYIFYQTRRSAVEIYERVLEAARSDNSLYHEDIRLFVKYDWPLPWVFEGFSHFYRNQIPRLGEKVDGIFLISTETNRAALEANLTQSYYVKKFEFDTFKVPNHAYFSEKVFGPQLKNDPSFLLFLPHSVQR